MIDAGAALARGEVDEAYNLKLQAEEAEPRLRRETRNAPKTIAELMPLLRRKEAAGPVMRQLRQSLGLTQSDIAEICGVTHGNVAHWESGRQAMREEAIFRLLQWMGERSAKAIGEGPLPAALLKLRRELGFTQAALAAKLGLKEPLVRRAETGNMPISMDIAERYRRLAAEHGIDLDGLAA